MKKKTADADFSSLCLIHGSHKCYVVGNRSALLIQANFNECGEMCKRLGGNQARLDQGQGEDREAQVDVRNYPIYKYSSAM